MPEIINKNIGLAFDMIGCPNFCRHCWLGRSSNIKLTEHDVRWGVNEFKEYFHKSSDPIENISVTTWFREPDYSDNYRQLFELEAELSDTEPKRYELLSIWRLANDPTYAEWAKSVGPSTCQISFFGMEDTTDWFYRRQGAFRSALSATERLIQAGIKPRWQVFLTTKLLPEINDFIELMESLSLKQRVAELGSGEFQLFLNLPGPEAEARNIEKYRPDMSQIVDLPEWLLNSTGKHVQDNELWFSEEELHSQIVSESSETGKYISFPNEPWLFISSNWDVYSNIGTLEKWWLLGNLKQDGVKVIIDTFESNRNLGLKTLFSTPPKHLATKYGNPKSKKIYTSKESLLSLYRAKYCEEEIKRDNNRIQ
jgi:hypothetical protein